MTTLPHLEPQQRQPLHPPPLQTQRQPYNQPPTPASSKIRLFISSYDNNCCQSTYFDPEYPPEIILHVSQIDYYNSLARLNAASAYPTLQLVIFRIFFLCFVGGLVYTFIEITHMNEAISVAFLVTSVSLLAFLFMLKYMRTTRNQRLLNAVQFENEIYMKRPLPSHWSIAHGEKAQPTLIIDFIQPSFANFIHNNTAVTSSYLATPPVYDTMQIAASTPEFPQGDSFTSSFGQPMMPPINLTYMNMGSSVLFPGLISPSAPDLTPPPSSPHSKVKITRSSTGDEAHLSSSSTSSHNTFSTNDISFSPPSIQRTVLHDGNLNADKQEWMTSHSVSADLEQPLIPDKNDDMV